jgi:hypothetical protein
VRPRRRPGGASSPRSIRASMRIHEACEDVVRPIAARSIRRRRPDAPGRQRPTPRASGSRKAGATRGPHQGVETKKPPRRRTSGRPPGSVADCRSVWSSASMRCGWTGSPDLMKPSVAGRSEVARLRAGRRARRRPRGGGGLRTASSAVNSVARPRPAPLVRLRRPRGWRSAMTSERVTAMSGS